MKEISSRWTALTKWATPFVWTALVIFLFVAGLREKEEKLGAPFYIWVVVFAIAGFASWWFLVRDFADKVYDCGDHLLVRRGDVEEKVPLLDILRVSESPFGESLRIVVHLMVPGRLGRFVAFMPPNPGLQINPFAKNRIVQDLNGRILSARDSARRESSARKSEPRPG